MSGSASSQLPSNITDRNIMTNSQLDIQLEDTTLGEDFFDEGNTAVGQPEIEDEDLLDVKDPFLGEYKETPIRDDALNIKGVDELSTADVKKIIEAHIPDNPFRIEWIDDHTLNLTFPSAEHALAAIRGLLTSPEYSPTSRKDMLTVKDVSPNDLVRESFPNVTLFVRYATADDVKTRGARNLSRYYLFYGEPDYRKEEKSRLSEGYQAYLDRISKNPTTQALLAKPVRQQGAAREIDDTYHQVGDLLPGFDRSRAPAQKKQGARNPDDGQSDDLFPQYAQTGRKSRNARQRSRSPPKRLEARINRNRSRSPPGRRFADIVGQRNPARSRHRQRQRASDMFE